MLNFGGGRQHTVTGVVERAYAGVGCVLFVWSLEPKKKSFYGIRRLLLWRTVPGFTDFCHMGVKEAPGARVGFNVSVWDPGVQWSMRGRKASASSGRTNVYLR